MSESGTEPPRSPSPVDPAADARAEAVDPPRAARVVVVSTRAAAGTAEDTTGPLIGAWAEGHGLAATVTVVPDGPAVSEAVGAGIREGVDLVVTTGGTGVAPSDRTPEHTRPHLELELPGLAEALRRRGADAVPTAVLSRGVAGTAGRTLVVNLPGSAGGVRDGMSVLDDVLDHVLAQLRGGDHARRRG